MGRMEQKRETLHAGFRNWKQLGLPTKPGSTSPLSTTWTKPSEGFIDEYSPILQRLYSGARSQLPDLPKNRPSGTGKVASLLELFTIFDRKILQIYNFCQNRTKNISFL